jgi:hypothetical protein
LEKILIIYPWLKPFLCQKKCPIVLKQFLENSETELWVNFAQYQASLFQELIKVIEGDDRCATESALAVTTLLLELQTRRNKHSILHMVKKSRNDLVETGEITMQILSRVSRFLLVTYKPGSGFDDLIAHSHTQLRTIGNTSLSLFYKFPSSPLHKH